MYTWRRQYFRFSIWQALYRFWTRIHVYGWDNIPNSGPVVMMGNHINMFDPVVMISFYPDRDIIPMAKIEAFSQPFMRYFVRHWGAIPVDRGEADLSALKLALDYLHQGQVVMLYAEGTRTKTGLIRAQEGSAYLAVKSGALVVPVAIWGTQEFPAALLTSDWLMDVYLSFGKPFRFRNEGNKLPREHFAAMSDEAMYQVAALLPAELRGYYSDLTRATTEFLDFDVQWEPPRTHLPDRAVAAK
jgi:1-acyl-sn-glycerol-3-phosphate acyltransferase